jgi:muconolactone delta-isomerase
MKYLIITKTKDVFFMLPDERRMVLMGAAMAFVDKLIKAHKMKDVHVMPGWNRTMFILDVESQEEAARLNLESPMRDYIDTEVYGLQEWDAYVKGVKHAYQQLAAKR